MRCAGSPDGDVSRWPKVAREALSAYVFKHQARGKSLSIIGIGRSGRRDIAERAEELLKEGFGR